MTRSVGAKYGKGLELRRMCSLGSGAQEAPWRGGGDSIPGRDSSSTCGQEVAAARLRGRGLILGAGALRGRSADEGPALTRLMLLRTGPRTKSRTKRGEQRVLA